MPDVSIPLLVVLFPPCVAIFAWALFRLETFICCAILAAMVFPPAIFRPGGAQVALADLLLLVALGAWFASMSLRARRGPLFHGNPIFPWSLAFVVVAAVTLIWSSNARATIQLVIQLVEIVLVFQLIFASVPNSLREIRTGFVVYIVVSVGLALLTAVLWLPKALAGDFQGQDVEFGLNKNAVGSFIAVGLVLAYALWAVAERGWSRRMLASANLVLMAGLLASISRGAIVGTLVAIVVMTLLLRRKRFLTISCVVIAAVGYLIIIGPGSGADVQISGAYDSSEVRVYSFENAVRKIQDRPFLGTGAGTYQDYVPQLDVYLPDPNNMLLLTWAEMGVFGLAVLLVLLYQFVRVWVACRQLPPEAAVLGIAAGGVSTSLLMHFQFDVTWTRGTASMAFAMMGLMLSVRRLAQAAEHEAPVPSAVGRRGAVAPELASAA